MVSTEQIKQLREETGVSVIQCKKALEEAGGDIAQARNELKKKGAEIAAKKSERELKSGIIASYIHSDKRIGVLVELLCETDFVAKNNEFQELGDDIAMHIAALNPSSREAGDNENEEGAPDEEASLLEQDFVKEPEITVRELIERSIQKLGENIRVSRFVRYEL